LQEEKFLRHISAKTGSEKKTKLSPKLKQDKRGGRAETTEEKGRVVPPKSTRNKRPV